MVSEPDADELDRRDAELARRGQGDAFERLVQRHQRAVAGWMWKFTRQRDEHEELVQDVFVAAFESLGGYRGRGYFSNWLRQVAVRTGYRYWRQRGRRVQLEGGEAAERLDQVDSGELPQSAVEAAETVHVLLAQLSPRDRLVLTLMYLEDCSVAEIAALTGWSHSLVKVQAHRARGRLRKLLEAGGAS